MKRETMPKTREAVAWDRVIGKLPYDVRREILQIGASRKSFPSGLSEIRLRAGGRCSIIFTCESIPLLSGANESELEEVLMKVVDGSVYAYRDTLAEGYIPIDGGVRVGVCGRARYDKGELVGIHGVSSLVFRLPFGECLFADKLAELFSGSSRSGLLIYAPPGGGKTTALRSLAKMLSSGAFAKRVCIIDERCEFFPEDYLGCEVDILRGYKRAEGIEIATRTLTPEIIVIDEIGASEAEGLRSVIRCGIPVIATAHAMSIDELFKKPSLMPLIRDGVFDLFAGIVKKDKTFGFVATTMPDIGGAS